jgi:hypothetical protein
MPNTFTITITKKGKDPRQWIQEVSKQIYPELQNEIVLSAEATAEIMRRILDNSGYNLKLLSGAIGVDVLSSTGGVHVGIGNIDTFPIGQESGFSYWELFDDGFKVTTANIGYFGDNFRAPEPGGSGEKWHHTGKGSGFFYMKPNKIIDPLEYSKIGYDELVKHITKQIEKFSRNLEQASK